MFFSCVGFYMFFIFLEGIEDGWKYYVDGYFFCVFVLVMIFLGVIVRVYSLYGLQQIGKEICGEKDRIVGNC